MANILQRIVLILLLLNTIKITSASNSEVKSMIRGIYGFNKKLDLFKGKSNEEIVLKLKQMKINAIWSDYKDRELNDLLHRQGIKIF